MAETLHDELDGPQTKEDSGGNDLDDLDNLVDIDAIDEGAEDGEESEVTTDAEGDGESKALDELEAEELEMLTEDEEAESLPVDEAEELRQIRHAAMSLESAADTAGDDEFVCSGCFLVKAGSQLADKRKKLCRDSA